MKKEIPLEILQIVEAFLKSYLNTLTVIKEEKTYYTIIDRDGKSNFFFRIFKEIPKDVTSSKANSAVVYTENFPNTSKLLKEGKTVLEYSSLNKYLEKWIEIIKGYNKIDSVYDDPFLKAYQEEFFADFELVDEDANTAPFNSKQLFLLDEYLENLNNDIEKIKDDSNTLFVEEIKNDTVALRDQLTTSTKNEVLKKLTLIWAKMQKKGIVVAKEFLSEGKKQIVKAIVNKGFELLLNDGKSLIDII